MTNNNLTYAEKSMIEIMLNERKEDKLDADFEARLDKILELFQAGESADMTYHQRMIVVQQIELKLETDLQQEAKEKFSKIRVKLLNI